MAIITGTTSQRMYCETMSSRQVVTMMPSQTIGPAASSRWGIAARVLGCLMVGSRGSGQHGLAQARGQHLGELEGDARGDGGVGVEQRVELGAEERDDLRVLDGAGLGGADAGIEQGDLAEKRAGGPSSMSTWSTCAGSVILMRPLSTRKSPCPSSPSSKMTSSAM